jgi:hypothetical protein
MSKTEIRNRVSKVYNNYKGNNYSELLMLIKKEIGREMKKNVVLKKNFRGLEAGTEFAYDPKVNAWKFETSGEEISDYSYKTHNSKVQFSDSYVKANTEVFDVPNVERDQRIKNLKDVITKAQDELSKLEGDGK